MNNCIIQRSRELKPAPALLLSAPRLNAMEGERCRQRGTAAPSAPAGAAAGGGLGVRPRTRPCLFRLWQQGNKNTPALLPRDDKRWTQAEGGVQRFAAPLPEHVQMLLCLRRPILKLRTCPRREQALSAEGCFVWWRAPACHGPSAAQRRSTRVFAAGRGGCGGVWPRQAMW